MGSIALTAPDSWGFLSGSTLYGGIANGFGGSGINVNVPAIGTVLPNGLNLAGGNATSYYVGATVATPVTGLRMGASWDYFDPHQPPTDKYAMSIAGYLSYQATEKLSFHARAEYFKDSGGVLFQTAGKAEVMALTGTIQYDLWKNVISRLEVRWDHSLLDTPLFGSGAANTIGGVPYQTAPNMENAVMIAANIIYKF
jgi:hypothetical protein